MAQTHDVRLFARIPSDLLARAHAAAEERGFSAWLRAAIEEKLARHDAAKVRTKVRTKAA
jgi:hypothetical protein